MKLTSLRSGFASVALMGMVAAAPLQASAALKSPVVAVVDVQAIVQQSAAAKNIKAQMDERLQSYQKEVAAQEEKLRAADQELTKQRAILKPEEQAEKRRAFQQQVAEVQRDVEQRKRILDGAFNKAMSTVLEKIRQIVTTQANAQGANVVLSRQQVVFADPSLDLTQGVLQTLNKDLPAVKVEFVDAAPAKAEAPAKKK